MQAQQQTIPMTASFQPLSRYPYHIIQFQPVTFNQATTTTPAQTPPLPGTPTTMMLIAPTNNSLKPYNKPLTGSVPKMGAFVASKQQPQPSKPKSHGFSLKASSSSVSGSQGKNGSMISKKQSAASAPMDQDVVNAAAILLTVKSSLSPPSSTHGATSTPAMSGNTDATMIKKNKKSKKLKIDTDSLMDQAGMDKSNGLVVNSHYLTPITSPKSTMVDVPMIKPLSTYANIRTTAYGTSVLHPKAFAPQPSSSLLSSPVVPVVDARTVLKSFLNSEKRLLKRSYPFGGMYDLADDDDDDDDDDYEDNDDLMACIELPRRASVATVVDVFRDTTMATESDTCLTPFSSGFPSRRFSVVSTISERSEITSSPVHKKKSSSSAARKPRPKTPVVTSPKIPKEATGVVELSSSSSSEDEENKACERSVSSHPSSSGDDEPSRSESMSPETIPSHPTERKQKVPSLPKEVDMSLYKDTTQAQPISWSKGGPMTFPADTPLLEALTPEEQCLCRTLRLYPQMYLTIKDAVIGATYTRPPFRKKEVRQWFPIDVNKVNKLYDWFLDLGWVPQTDEEWAKRRDWYRAALANKSG